MWKNLKRKPLFNKIVGSSGERYRSINGVEIEKQVNEALDTWVLQEDATFEDRRMVNDNFNRGRGEVRVILYPAGEMRSFALTPNQLKRYDGMNGIDHDRWKMATAARKMESLPPPRETVIKSRLEEIQSELISLFEERERLQREYGDLHKDSPPRMKSCGDD